MRRVLAVVAILLAIAVLLWLVFAMGSDGAGPGGDGANGPAPADATAEEVRLRGASRGGPKVVEEPVVAEPVVDLWGDLGQERALKDAGTVVGRLLTAPDQPAERAIVEALVARQVVARARVGEGGRFELKNVPAVVGVDIEARAQGYAPGGMARVVLAKSQRLDIGTLYVGLAIDPSVDNELTVRVTDAEGNPLEGARVTATTLEYGMFVALRWLAKEPGGVVLREETDARGQVRYGPMPPAPYDVFVEADGYTFRSRQRYVMQRDTKATIDFALDAGLSIVGKTIDAEGNPVAAAMIGALSFGDFAMVPSVESDEEGKFTLGGLRDAGYMLFALKEDLGGAMAQNVRPGGDEIVVTIEQGEAMRLKVVDQETGEPIPSFGVRPYRNIPFGYIFSPIVEVENADGIFETVMPPASYGVEVSATAYQLGRVANVPLGSDEPILVELVAAGVVHGRVVAKQTGRPIVGAKIYVKRGGFPSTPYKDLQTVSDGDGVFVLDKLGLEPLNFRITHVDHTEENIEGVTPVARSEAGELPAARDFAIGSGGTVEGRVFDERRLPAVGETVYLTLSGFDTSFNRSTTVNAAGGYSFAHVPAGPIYTLSVGSYMPGQGGSSKSDVNVSEGGITTVDFGADVGSLTLRGRVVREGNPAANVALTLASADGGTSREQSRTDAAGVFVFEGVSPGKYLVTAEGSRRMSVEVILEDGKEPAEVVLDLVSSGVAGVVTDAETGQPLSGVYVECERVVAAGGSSLTTVSKAYKGGKISGQDGSFAFQGLEAGSYRLRTYSDRHGVELVEGIEIAEGAVVEGLQIELSAGGAFSGFVRTAAGAPVEGATIHLEDTQGRSVFLIGLTQSSSDGSYTQSSLKPGTYMVRIEKDGYAPSSHSVMISVGAPGNLDVVLLQGGRIELSVTDDLGNPGKNLRIRLFDAAGAPVTRGLALGTLFSLKENKTDARGQAELAGLAPGSYTVQLLRVDTVVGSGVAQVVEGGGTSLRVQVLAE